MTDQKSLIKIVRQAYPKQVSYLQKLAQSGTINHAYAVIATTEGGQNSVIDLWINMLLCGTASPDKPICLDCSACVALGNNTHADFFSLTGTVTDNLGVEDAKQLRKHLSAPPTIGQYRIAVIKEAHFMSLQAANGLLKIIEEPPKSALIIIGTSSPDDLPSTLLSRVQQIRLPMLDHDNVREIVKDNSTNVSDQEQVTHLAAGKLDRLVKLLDPDLNEHAAWLQNGKFWLEFIEANVAARDDMIRQRFLTGANSKEAIHSLPKMIDYIAVLLRDVMVLSLQLDGFITFQKFADRLETLNNKWSGHEIQIRLEKMTELKKMCLQNVNKKLIFDYLIFGL